MPTVKLKKAEKTRANIIEASAVLFNQQGFSGTSIKDIMKATGLSKGGLYGHFPGGKEEISVEAFKYAVDITYAKIGQRTRVIENNLDKLKAVIYFYKENIFSPPVEGGCPLQNTSIEADDNNPVLREQVVAALENWHHRIVHTLRKGIERNEVIETVDINDFATFYIGAIEGGILLARTHRDVAKFDVMAKQILRRIDAIRK